MSKMCSVCENDFEPHHLAANGAVCHSCELETKRENWEEAKRYPADATDETESPLCTYCGYPSCDCESELEDWVHRSEESAKE